MCLSEFVTFQNVFFSDKENFTKSLKNLSFYLQLEKTKKWLQTIPLIIHFHFVNREFESSHEPTTKV